MRTISLSKITAKDTKNFEPFFEMFLEKAAEIEKENSTKRAAKLIKFVVECDFHKPDHWFDKKELQSAAKSRNLPMSEIVRESEMLSILGRVLIIRMNNLAQKKLNNIDMEPNHVQLNNDKEFMKFFKDTKFVK